MQVAQVFQMMNFEERQIPQGRKRPDGFYRLRLTEDQFQHFQSGQPDDPTQREFVRWNDRQFGQRYAVANCFCVFSAAKDAERTKRMRHAKRSKINGQCMGVGQRELLKPLNADLREDVGGMLSARVDSNSDDNELIFKAS